MANRPPLAAAAVTFALVALAVAPFYDPVPRAQGAGETPGSPGGRIAITIDDVPWTGPRPPTRSVRADNQRLLSALKRRDVPVAGLVTCSSLRDGELLEPWLEAGATLGNHSYSHLDLNSTPLSRWLADVARCDSTLAAITGTRPVYFRYPYLHRGGTRHVRDSARSALLAQGRTIAPVSVDNSEWLLARPYVEAVAAGDSARISKIGQAYVDHILEAVAHFQAVARSRLGRDVDHILLLHANAPAADHLGSLLDRLAAEGFEFISLEEALRDPVYVRPDGYLGRKGLSWLYRFEPATPDLAEWDDAEAARLRRWF